MSSRGNPGGRLVQHTSQVQEGGEESFEDEDEEEQALTTSPVWLNSALTHLRSTTHPGKLVGPSALGYIVHRRGGFARDLRESWDFMTVPPAGEGEKKSEVVVSHLLPQKGLRVFSKTGGEREIGPEKGEKLVISLSAGALGTFWWKWGDLEGDLAGKRFRADQWWDGDWSGGEEQVSGDQGGEQGEWVESEGPNRFGVTMEVENEAEIEFA